MRVFLLIVALLCWLAAVPLGVVAYESHGPTAEGLAGLAFMAALFGGALASGLFLMMATGEEQAGLRTAGAVMMLAPFALLGGAGWTGFALMLAGSLAYAARSAYRALTRSPKTDPPSATP